MSIGARWLISCAAAVVLIASAATYASSIPQAAGDVSSEALAKPDAKPVLTEHRGVKLGMNVDDVRAALGKPSQPGERIDIFTLSDAEMVSVYYDDRKQATALVVNYSGDANTLPKPEQILGIPLEADADGTMTKMVRYPDAGYWVSYTRTGGDAPAVFVTLKRIDPAP